MTGSIGVYSTPSTVPPYKPFNIAGLISNDPASVSEEAASVMIGVAKEVISAPVNATDTLIANIADEVLNLSANTETVGEIINHLVTPLGVATASPSLFFQKISSRISWIRSPLPFVIITSIALISLSFYFVFRSIYRQKVVKQTKDPLQIQTLQHCSAVNVSPSIGMGRMENQDSQNSLPKGIVSEIDEVSHKGSQAIVEDNLSTKLSMVLGGVLSFIMIWKSAGYWNSQQRIPHNGAQPGEKSLLLLAPSTGKTTIFGNEEGSTRSTPRGLLLPEEVVPKGALMLLADPEKDVKNKLEMKAKCHSDLVRYGEKRFLLKLMGEVSGSQLFKNSPFLQFLGSLKKRFSENFRFKAGMLLGLGLLAWFSRRRSSDDQEINMEGEVQKFSPLTMRENNQNKVTVDKEFQKKSVPQHISQVVNSAGLADSFDFAHNFRYPGYGEQLSFPPLDTSYQDRSRSPSPMNPLTAVAGEIRTEERGTSPLLFPSRTVDIGTQSESISESNRNREGSISPRRVHQTMSSSSSSHFLSTAPRRPSHTPTRSFSNPSVQFETSREGVSSKESQFSGSEPLLSRSSKPSSEQSISPASPQSNQFSRWPSHMDWSNVKARYLEANPSEESYPGTENLISQRQIAFGLPGDAKDRQKQLLYAQIGRAMQGQQGHKLFHEQGWVPIKSADNTMATAKTHERWENPHRRH